MSVRGNAVIALGEIRDPKANATLDEYNENEYEKKKKKQQSQTAPKPPEEETLDEF